MRLILIVLMCLLFGGPVFAKQVTVNTVDLPFEVAKTILLSQKGGESLKVLDDENLKKVIAARGSFDVDDSVLPNDLRQRLDAARKLSEVTSNLQVGRDWAEMGRAIGIATREGLNAVTTETAKFAETTPGKFTMFMIAWKVAGADFLKAVKGYLIGVPLLIAWACLFYWWLKRVYHGYQKKITTVAEGKTTSSYVWTEPLLSQRKDGEFLFMMGVKALCFVIIGGMIFLSI